MLRSLSVLPGKLASSRSLAILSLAILSLVAIACGESEPEGPPPPETERVSCADDPRVDAYTANMAKEGDNGVLTFRFSEADPAPPAKGMNTLRVEVRDATGAPMLGALTVDLDMPDHGHGTSVPPATTFDSATSTYTVESLYMFMAGVWRIDFAASTTEGAEPVDEAALHFCIEG